MSFPAPPARKMRLLRGASAALGLLLALVFITLPMGATAQAWLTVAGIGVFLLLNRNKSRLVSVILVMLSVIITSRYLYWRATETLEFETFLQAIFGSLLFLAEVFAGLLMALSYIQTTYPLDRKPVPLPRDVDSWPMVDVYIPTYNEDLDLVRPTVLAAMNMDYPRDKLNVWILDDGRRPAFREFAEEVGCGYIIRPDNKGAKAGNLNHAMKHTPGEFIAIFDCDHAPTRAFLQLTLGWLVRDKKLSMVQTPHHFYSPDPFERNLARKRAVPNEGLLFYGLIQPGNDLWNAAFFCGSCAVIRRSALEEVGGVAHETVTEDAHTAFRMQQKGWDTAYIRIPLASGLATERLALHIGQRMRWARGMLQIMRIENTLFARGLTVMQRLCYFIAQFGFMFAIPRIVFLTSPLVFLFLGESVIAASPLAILAYAGGHIFHAIATTARLNGPHRHSFWSEIYEASLAAQLVPVTILTLLDPRKGKFNVTDKGGTLDEGYLDVQAVLANLILLVLVGIGFVIGLVGYIMAESGSLEARAYLLNTIWAGLALVPLSAGVAVGREREQSRLRARVAAHVPGELVLADGTRLPSMTQDLSLSGTRLRLDRPLGLADGDRVELLLHSGGEEIPLKATVVRWEGNDAYLQFVIEDLQDEANVVRAFFGRADAWLYWDKWPQDRPLRSLANVIAATADVVFNKYRFGRVRMGEKPVPPEAAKAAAEGRASGVVPPRRPQAPGAAKVVTAGARVVAGLAALLLLLGAGGALAQQPRPAQRAAPAQAQPAPEPPPPLVAPAPLLAPTPLPEPAPVLAPIPSLPPPPSGARVVTRTLRDLGLTGPMQLRGTQDLQGVLFGLRADEVVTEASLIVSGAASPSLIPSLSQVAVTLNEQAVGAIPIDAARQAFGPLEFPVDPLFFSEINRLNFRFSGRYTTECNDPNSGLLWANVSDLSTMRMRIERLPPQRDLSRLPEPLFDRRVLQGQVSIPVVIPEGAGPSALRAAGIAASWFAVQADYRGATFPVGRALPREGDAIILATGPDAVPGLTMPRMDGPTLAMLPHPDDPFGTLLVLGGRSEAELVPAALALVAARGTLAGEIARVVAPTIPPRQPYDSPRWVRTDQPLLLGALVEREALQATGFSTGAIRVPLRTSPDILTFRGRGFPVDLRFRAPEGPIIDVASSRLDVSVSGSYLRSFRLADPEPWIPTRWATDPFWQLLGFDPVVRGGRAIIPPYLLLGRDELQLRFDMRPLNRGDCVDIPSQPRAALEPDSTIDLSRLHRFAQMPNLGFFASAGFPFTRMADLSGTAAVLPERASTVEQGAFLDAIGQLSAITGIAATGLQVVTPPQLASAAARDLLVIGALGRQPALNTLLRDAPVRMEGERLSIALPDAFQEARALILSAPSREERSRASAALGTLGEGFGAVLGAESPLQAGRSVVAITGATPAAVAQMVQALRDPVQAPAIQGDTAVLSAGAVQSFRTMAPYHVGEAPWWLLPQIWLGDRPERALLLLLAVGALLGLPVYWILRRREVTRLRSRS
ncbi:MAG TPA: UDP-forming cellulose synthase catalytic subunit [Roseococcus sp.]|nr:UDP-forming cellulose synthase catalytic subunit [Roseococcus sp.]